MENLKKVRRSAAYIQEKIGKVQAGTWGVVLGTGLGAAADTIDAHETLEYADIPGFPTSGVEGHAGRLVIGELAGRPVLALCGRFHLYEGYAAGDACHGVRTLGELGVETLVLTNAAGALNPAYATGDLMALADHINLTGESPLTGPNVDAWGERFPDMSRVWDRELLARARKAALARGIRLEEGVYAQVRGPQLETPAETRMLRTLGADAVGMSTAVEAIAAHHMGMRLFGVSCLTNKNLPDCMAPTSLKDVLQQADKSSGRLAGLLAGVAASP